MVHFVSKASSQAASTLPDDSLSFSSPTAASSCASWRLNIAAALPFNAKRSFSRLYPRIDYFRNMGTMLHRHHE